MQNQVFPIVKQADYHALFQKDRFNERAIFHRLLMPKLTSIKYVTFEYKIKGKWSAICLITDTDTRTFIDMPHLPLIPDNPSDYPDAIFY
jgi:hypothetical protein